MEALDKIVSLIAGKGLLDIRVWIASVVGPMRLPLGKKKTHQLPIDAEQGTLIATNIATANAIVVVGIAGESLQNTVGTAGLLSNEPDMGATSWPVQLLPLGNIYPITVILLPGDQLYARAAEDTIRIIVSEVTF